MGVRNVLIEGISGTGKTSVCDQLWRRGYHAIHGDRSLACRGDPESGRPVSRPRFSCEADSVAWVHEHHIWDVAKLASALADHRRATTFFCGGARDFPRFIALFDAVFVLDLDRDTLTRRLVARPTDEFGARPSERELILRLHATREGVPDTGVEIDATAPLDRVVDEILAKCGVAVGEPRSR